MMSSKISQIYPLTEYPTGHIMDAWPRLRCKAINANVANTLGFPGRPAKGSQRFVRAVNRLIGIHPESQTEKRQSGDKLVRCSKKAVAQVQQKTLEIRRPDAVKWCGRRDSNSQGWFPYQRHPTRVTVWRVNQFRHVRVCKAANREHALNGAAGWVRVVLITPR